MNCLINENNKWCTKQKAKCSLTILSEPIIPCQIAAEELLVFIMMSADRDMDACGKNKGDALYNM